MAVASQKQSGMKWGVGGLTDRLRQSLRVRETGGGFTLLELTMVMALILILASFALPAYHIAIQRARESVLRDDLYTLRSTIDEFTVDKQHPPASLQDMVDSGYLHSIPIDPITGSADTWNTDVEDVPVPPDQTASGIVDVHSGSDEKALDGTAYSTW